MLYWTEIKRCLLGNNLWRPGGLMVVARGEAVGR